MDAIARFLVRHSRVVLAATAVATLVALAMLPRLAFDVDITSFLLRSTPEGRALLDLQEAYGAGDPITVVLTRDDGERFTNREGLARIAEVRDALAGLEAVDAVGALVPETDPLAGEPLDAERIRSLPAPLAFSLTALLQNSPAADLLLAEDGRVTMLMVLPGVDAIAAARQVKAADLPDGVSAVLAGNPMVFAELLDMLGWFLLAIPPTVIVLLLIVFTLALGSPRLAALSIVPAILGSVWTFGLIFGLGLEVDIVTVIVPIFVIVMGSADGLHFVSHLQDAAERGEAKAERVAAALREVGVPMILTTLSTAAGFLSLLATGVAPLQQLGVFVAAGIGLAGVISFLPLPALMSRLDLAPRGDRARFGTRVVGIVERMAVRRWPAAALAVALIAVSAFGIPRLQVVSSQLFFFADDHPLREAFDRVSEAFGGATPLFGEFAWDPSAPLEPQLDAIRDATREMEALPGVRDVLSVADLVGSLPARQADAVLRGERTPPMGPMVSDDGLRFILFPSLVADETVQAWRETAAALPEIRTFTGTPLLFDALNRVVVRGQAVSLALAFALVAVLLLATYRRLGTTLLALAPIALTVATLLAFLALSGIHLNLLTAIASSIVIGVGIDYAIHLIAALEHARAEGDERIRSALHTAGRPILANALGIPVGLSALFLSPLAPHGQIATIMWVAMLTAAATTLLVIPALVPRPDRSGGVVD